MANSRRFSPQAREILVTAQTEADERRHNFIDTDHILLAFLKQKSSDGATKALQDCGATYNMLSDLVGRNPYITSSKRLELSRDSKQMLELAVAEMKRKGARQITLEHLLIGLLQIETCAGVELLFQAKYDIKRLYATMDIPLPTRVIRQHQQRIQLQAQDLNDTNKNEGCIPGIINGIMRLFIRGKQ